MNSALKTYFENSKYLHKVFGADPPKWLLKGIRDVYERTKNSDISEMDKGNIWKEEKC
jgi:hypothetical protein